MEALCRPAVARPAGAVRRLLSGRGLGAAEQGADSRRTVSQPLPTKLAGRLFPARQPHAEYDDAEYAGLSAESISL